MASEPKLPRQWPLRVTVAAMVVAAAVWIRWSSVHQGIWGDLDVYTRGAQAILTGEPLYDVVMHDLPFTYSPFSALIFTPLTLMPVFAARILFSFVSVLCYVAIMVVYARKLDLPLIRAVIVGAAALSLEPFIRNMLLGQINSILILMVVVDCLVLPAKLRGALVGVAAGIKIIPGVFVLYFILKRDWRAALRAGIAFAFTVVLGAVASPEASWRYWSGGFAALNRFGGAALIRGDNQSLSAAWMRLAHDPSPSIGLSLVFCAIGVGLGAWAAVRQFRKGDDPAALACLALGSLLASPVSWTHHWLWIAPILLLLTARRRWLSAWSLGVLFWLAPMWFSTPGHFREPQFNFWQQLVAICYVVSALVLLTMFIADGRELRGPGSAAMQPVVRTKVSEGEQS